jgi:hypothetical protein
VVQREARGETGATMERMGGEEGILPERSEWFRSTRIIGSDAGAVWLLAEGKCFRITEILLIIGECYAEGDGDICFMLAEQQT